MITGQAASSLAAIHQLVGELQGLVVIPAPTPNLRRRNRIRTIRDTLAIEGNTLSEEQVTAILERRRVIGPKRDVLEAINATRAYERLDDFVPLREKSLLAAHALFMRELVPDTGRYRSGGVGIFRGARVTHVAPPAKRVPAAMRKLFSFLGRDRETPALIRAAVFHYELEFIHPFTDGNGRLGRFWQHLLIRSEFAVFEHVPIESTIRARQADYYRALERSDRAGRCDAFIELMLELMLEGLRKLAPELRSAAPVAGDRLEHAREKLGRRWFDRKSYLALFQQLSTATASRDLRDGVESRVLELRGERRFTQYRFRSRR